MDLFPLIAPAGSIDRPGRQAPFHTHIVAVGWSVQVWRSPGLSHRARHRQAWASCIGPQGLNTFDILVCAIPSTHVMQPHLLSRLSHTKGEMWKPIGREVVGTPGKTSLSISLDP